MASDRQLEETERAFEAGGDEARREYDKHFPAKDVQNRGNYSTAYPPATGVGNDPTRVIEINLNKKERGLLPFTISGLTGITLAAQTMLSSRC